ncbi:MAG: type IV secretory system conjugative DNA transfer family protein [Conexivisphaerales archaeon]
MKRDKDYIANAEPITSYNVKVKSNARYIILLIPSVYLAFKAAYYIVQVNSPDPSFVIKSVNEAVKYILDYNLLNYMTKQTFIPFLVATLVSIVVLILGIQGMIFKGHIEIDHPYKGIEQGSARFGKIPEEIQPLIDEAPKGPYYYNKNNIILSDRVGLSLDTYKTRRNNNVLVIGGSGTGKTRYFIKPNILQAHSSYVVTDPKGEIMRETGYFLKKVGYKVKVFDLIDMEFSSKYNPFNYFIKGEDDTYSLIDTMLKSIYQGQSMSSEPFWEQSSALLLTSLMSYIYTELPKRERNIGTLMTMIEYLNDYQILDGLFEDLKQRKGNVYPYLQWKNFKTVFSSERTTGSIFISVTSTLQVFNIPRIRRLMSEDTLELDKIGEVPTVLFIVIPDSVKVFNFIAAMIYKQLFQVLYYKADKIYKGPLPIHVRLLLDEFPNIGKISDFEQILSTVRSRNISCSVIVQDISQLKEIYKNTQDSWENIVANCSSLLFLGSQTTQTSEYISRHLGRTTIDTRDESLQYSKDLSQSESVKKSSRELMTPDEVSRLPIDHCLVKIQGAYPFYDKKFELKSHPNYKYTAEVTGKHYTTKDRLKQEVMEILDI